MIADLLPKLSRYLVLPLLIALFNLPLFAQIAVGQWRDHLPYNAGVQVADAGNWIYAASESGLFEYNKADGDIERLSKISGLSDVGCSAIAWSDANSTLVIAYTNTNIDLIQDGHIINIPDIKDKSILGNKTINNIHIKGDYAYLACGFAIVVLDMVKHEIKDTYYIGSDGAALNVFDVSTSADELFACTENGVYHAALNGTNLANYENWTRFSDIPIGEYDAGTWFNSRLYVNLATSGIDTIYYYQNQQWTRFDSVSEETVRSLESSDYGMLLVISSDAVAEYDADHVRHRLTYQYGDGQYASPRHAMVDEQGTMWIADHHWGLIKQTQDLNVKLITVNGPSAASSTDMSIWDGRCYVASGSLTPTWGNGYNPNGIYSFKDNEWVNISPFDTPETEEMRDFVHVLVDPFDSKRVYAATWGWGLVEYYDDQLVSVYDTSNSTIDVVQGSQEKMIVSGLEIDKNTGTLWAVSSNSEHELHAKDNLGNWYGFDLSAISNTTLGDLAIDNAGQKWMVAPRGTGLVVFNDNGTLSNTDDDQSIKLTQNLGNGNLASNNIFSIASDLDGEIWVGTDNGISVFYSPESVFSGDNFDSQQILIEQDGYVQYLLANEGVSAIAVDGANRKWIGTQKAGVFLMSADGTDQILHFTTENSPIFSNEITALGIDHLSGEVYIGTNRGIISYRGTATWGTPEFVSDDVYAFPNPVEPDYDGPIAIKGLVRDADVKITDVSGRAVFATQAEGGQAIWNGNSFDGSRAHSGVYLVFASNEDGKQTFVTKILFIR